ncbi:MAG: hypothetical protein PSN04_01195, partial [Methyloprofundus sp.]|nr:hypothetical protein [Methyloprofundus sp.]
IMASFEDSKTLAAKRIFSSALRRSRISRMTPQISIGSPFSVYPSKKRKTNFPYYFSNYLYLSN